jgi:hypothetical protein
MGLYEILQWIVGVYFKYNMIYGVLLGLVISLIIASVERSFQMNDKNCKGYLLLTIPQMIALSSATFFAIAQFFLKDWAQGLINASYGNAPIPA